MGTKFNQSNDTCSRGEGKSTNQHTYHASTTPLRDATMSNTRPVSSLYIWSENFGSPSEAKHGGQWSPKFRQSQSPYAVFHVYVRVT